MLHLLLAFAFFGMPASWPSCSSAAAITTITGTIATADARCTT
jgi:hypothetical protein